MKKESLFQYEIDCAFEQNVSMFDLADAPVYEIRTASDEVVRMADIIEHEHSANPPSWTRHFVAVVDAENDLVAIVPRAIASVIVRALNRAIGDPADCVHRMRRSDSGRAGTCGALECGGRPIPMPGCVHRRVTDTMPSRCIACGEIVGRP